MDATNTSITLHLEGFIHSAKKLEDSLAEERKRSQRIAQEYLATRTKLEGAVRELQGRVLQREKKIQAFNEALKNASESEARLKNELRELAERERKASAELAHYQSAWSEVLAREATARDIVIEHEKTKLLLEEAKKTASIHFRNAETYHRELQAAIGRIQTAEAKYAQAQKELTLLSRNQRNVDTEIARIETNLRAQLQQELVNERSRLRSEAEHYVTVERNRVRESARGQIRAEMEAEVAREREARIAAESTRHADMERARARLLALTDENERSKAEIRRLIETKNGEIDSLHERTERAEKNLTALKAELAMHQIEAANQGARLETQKREATKNLLVERLKFEASLEAMREKVERLLATGFYAEKIDTLPDGVNAVTAYPVSEPPFSSRSLADQPHL
jgi:DNA repair exonuclease SbcCD ATPase subunit